MAPSDLSGQLKALQTENRRLRRAVEELSVLNELAREIGSLRDSDAIMRQIVKRSLSVVGAEQGVINMVDEQEQDQAKTLIRTNVKSGEHHSIHLNEHVLGWVQRYQKPILMNDPVRDERFRFVRWGAEVRSLLAVPLLVKSRLKGVLTVYNKKTGGFTEDDQRLLSIIAAQSAQVIENARLYRGEKALIRMQEQLRLAHGIQTNLLPKQPVQIPGYDIAGYSLPAQTVGGDFFDYISINDRLTAFSVGDVVGKGTPAALLMANMQASVRGQALWAERVDICVERINTLLHRSTSKRDFVTLFYGVLDHQDHLLRYVNAGHNRPLHYAADRPSVELTNSDLVLGVMPQHKYREHELPLAPGEGLLIYSDGVSEAMNDGREEYGETNLKQLLQHHAHEPAQQIIDRIVTEVKTHSGPTAQADDMTLMVIRRLGT